MLFSHTCELFLNVFLKSRQKLQIRNTSSQRGTIIDPAIWSDEVLLSFSGDITQVCMLRGRE